MFNLILYWGLPLDREFEYTLSGANPHMVSLLTGGGDYLSEFSHKGRRYLGKPLPPSPTFTQLEACQTHLLSLLRKLAPEYPFSKNPPILMTLPASTGNGYS